MRLIVDTNLLVRVARDDDAVQSPEARRLLAEADAIVITLPTLCEFVWVMRRPYRWPRLQLHAAVAALVARERVVVDADAVAAGLAFLAAGGDFADGVIAFDGRRLGGEVFASFDRAALKIAAAAGFAVISAPNDPLGS